MKVLFYAREADADVAPAADLPMDLTMRAWRPAEHGPPPPGPRRRDNLAWWALSGLGLMARRDLMELSIWRGDDMLHRLIVTPRWYRFPFMARDDLQIGDVWTHPDARGQGLASTAIREAHRRAAGHATRLWYLIRPDNAPSIRLIESLGYHPIGEGRRSHPLGLAPLGQFQLCRSPPADPPASAGMSGL